MRGGVVDENAALLRHFLDMPQAQRVGHVPAHAGQHDFQRVVKLLEDFAQGTVDQLLAQIDHGRDCHLSLTATGSGQNQPSTITPTAIKVSN